jgi:hypothetical protein
MTLQMAIGRLICEKIVGQRDEYPKELVARAKNVLENIGFWEKGKVTHRAQDWHIKSNSWVAFKYAAQANHVDLSEILQDRDE